MLFCFARRGIGHARNYLHVNAAIQVATGAKDLSDYVSSSQLPVCPPMVHRMTQDPARLFTFSIPPGIHHVNMKISQKRSSALLSHRSRLRAKHMPSESTDVPARPACSKVITIS